MVVWLEHKDAHNNDECIEYLKIDSNFDAIVEVTFEIPGLPFIDRVIWLDQENN